MLVALKAGWGKSFAISLVVAACALLAFALYLHKIPAFWAPGHDLGVVGLDLDHGEIFPIISGVHAGSPGEKAGFSREDILLAINDKNTALMCERQVVWSLRGPVSEPVKLTVLTHDDRLVVKKVWRIWPGDLPGGADNLMYTKRPLNADLPLQEPLLKTALSETPWCMANPVRTEIYFDQTSSAWPKLEHRPDPLVSVCRRYPFNATPKVLKMTFSVTDPQVRQFAQRFGIDSAPAKIVLDSLNWGAGGPVHVESASVKKELTRVLPGYGYLGP